ncbi:MAG: hypothetical protein AMS18_17735 [Gemmatimonas sp. SG8_17]|nr:MAG: hypothetical protein AMS18_17735 [Gemmatimonas sp. SG8_17]
MTAFFAALFELEFLQRALLGGALASVGCGIMGTYVVVKRIGYLAGGIAHAVLGGMGVAYYLDLNPMLGAIAAAVVAALLVGWVNIGSRRNSDTVIGALWATGMAIGILFISRSPGYNVDLMSYLFGNILMVSAGDLRIMVVLDVLVVVLVLLFYRQLIAVAFDQEFARLRGVAVRFFELLLLCVVALTVVTLIQVVGLILVIALLTLPAAIASQYARSLAGMMVLATGIGVVLTVGGLALSYEPDLPAGATIILLAGLLYLVSTAAKNLVHRMRLRRLRQGA